MLLQDLIIPIGAAIVSFAVAAGFAAWVSRQKPGTQQMLDISNAVKVGAMVQQLDFRTVLLLQLVRVFLQLQD